jgi:hypothetical protein
LKPKQPHTAEEFDWYVMHAVIGFYDVPTRERVRILRKYASKLQRGLDEQQIRLVHEQSCNDPAAMGS